MTLILTLNVLVLTVAVVASRRQKKLKWLPHAISTAWLLCSIFLLAYLGLADIPDEQNGPLAQEVILLPVAAQIVVTILWYGVAMFWAGARRTMTFVRTR